MILNLILGAKVEDVYISLYKNYSAYNVNPGINLDEVQQINGESLWKAETWQRVWKKIDNEIVPK